MFKLLILATLVALACGASLGPLSLPLSPVPGIGSAPIVGGSAAAITEAPYQAAGLFGSSSFSLRCGGSIISTTVILTAAHCTVSTAASSWRIRVGSALWASGGDLHVVSAVVNHGSYSSSTLDYDISLLRLSVAITTSTSKVIASMPAQGASVTTGASALITGWGTTTAGGTSIPAQLRKVTVPVVAQATCVSNYAGFNTVTDRMICAGLTAGGADACQGDSGGPMYVGGLLVGVVSWGRSCALAGYPGVYARVAALRTWINNNA